MTRNRLQNGLITLMFCCLVALAAIVLNASSKVKHNQGVVAKLAIQNAVNSKQALALAKQVQHQNILIEEQRYNSTLDGCQETNNRHRHVIKLLHQDLKKAPPQEKANASQTIAFINALVPFRNCQVVALRVTKTPSHNIPKPPRQFLIPRAVH